MARYKEYNYDQLKLLPISFSRQILPGTFEYTPATSTAQAVYAFES